MKTEHRLKYNVNEGRFKIETWLNLFIISYIILFRFHTLFSIAFQFRVSILTKKLYNII